MTLYVIGVDPGLKGGIALVGPDALTMIRGEHMPTMERAGGRGKKLIVDVVRASEIMNDMVGRLRGLDSQARVVGLVERVHAMPAQGVTSAFNFGHNAGMIEAVLRLSLDSVSTVSPSQWMGKMGLNSDPSASLALARDRFGPHEAFRYKTKDGVADSALMAAYWLKEHSGK